MPSDARLSPSLSSATEDRSQVKVKKPKRAETRSCPVCFELIPIRLLAAHAELEAQRVGDIITHIGDAEVLAEVDDLEEGPCTSKRRSALKARQSLTALQPSPRVRASSSTLSILADTTTPVAIEHAIGYITRRRRARHARLRELAKEEETWRLRSRADVNQRGDPAGIVCPVCSQTVHGDRDVIEAHVDACLAYESQRVHVERERKISNRLVQDADVDVDIDVDMGSDAVEGSIRTRIITNASLRGTGIHVRPSTMDTEDEIDIDGSDDALFGGAQYGEADVEKMGEAGNAGQQQTERPQGTNATEDLDQLDLAILTARSRGDDPGLIIALEAKLNAIPAPATCRICLSPYVDPTVSTGCWHTCCAACWLRCLGTTKLCPMCQRITGASELRRVYL